MSCHSCLLFLTVIGCRHTHLQQRPQQLLAIKAVEPCRHDADHGIRYSVDLNGFPDDVRIGSKTVFPECVAEHHELTSPGLVLLWRKELTQQGLHAENWKEVIGNYASCNALRRLSRAADIELPRDMISHMRQQSALLFPVKEILGGEEIAVSVG